MSLHNFRRTFVTKIKDAIGENIHTNTPPPHTHTEGLLHLPACSQDSG